MWEKNASGLDASTICFFHAEQQVQVGFAARIHLHDLPFFRFRLPAAQGQAHGGRHRKFELFGEVVILAHGLFFVVVGIDNDFVEDAVFAEGVVGVRHEW